MRQERNEHDLMNDFREELPGYLNNTRVCEVLGELPLQSGLDKINDNLRSCYEALVKLNVIDQRELPLLDAWISDLDPLYTHAHQPVVSPDTEVLR